MRSGQRGTLNLTLATIAFTICFTSWGLVAPLAKHLQTPNGWSDTQVLLLAAVPVLCGSLLRLPAGWLADRFGGRLIFTVTMVLSIVPALLLGYVTSYDALAGGRLLHGCRRFGVCGGRAVCRRLV